MESNIKIDYSFEFFGKRPAMRFLVEIDRQTGVIIPPKNLVPASWTELEYYQCENCPFAPSEVAVCPIAFNISDVVERFKDVFSIERSMIMVKTVERTYLKEDKVSQGLRSILGLYLAASGCPNMDILKPMARFHLPFASLEETIQRHAGNFLLHEYFKRSGSGQSSLEGFAEKMLPVDLVNRGLCCRLESHVQADANRNALAVLNLFGSILGLEIERLRGIYGQPLDFRADL